MSITTRKSVNPLQTSEQETHRLQHVSHSIHYKHPNKKHVDYNTWVIQSTTNIRTRNKSITTRKSINPLQTPEQETRRLQHVSQSIDYKHPNKKHVDYNT